MKFSIYVAKKFLLKDKKSAPSKITGWIAVVGLAVGCMAMVLSLSVLNGFENRIINKIIGFESDLRLTQADDWESALDIIPEIKGVKAIMPFQERKAIIIGRGGTQRMVSLKAAEIEIQQKFNKKLSERNQEISQTQLERIKKELKQYSGKLQDKVVQIKLTEAIKRIDKFCGVGKSKLVKDNIVVQTMRYMELLKELKKSGSKDKKVI